jgi:hypothetical protein
MPNRVDEKDEESKRVPKKRMYVIFSSLDKMGK